MSRKMRFCPFCGIELDSELEAQDKNWQIIGTSFEDPNFNRIIPIWPNPCPTITSSPPATPPRPPCRPVAHTH